MDTRSDLRPEHPDADGALHDVPIDEVIWRQWLTITAEIAGIIATICAVIALLLTLR